MPAKRPRKPRPPKATQRETEMASEIKSLLALARTATVRGSFASAVSARTKVSALRTELARLKAERMAEAETDPLLRVQRLRRMATEAGSYVAASSLTKVEAELIAARALAAAAAKGDGFDNATDDDILAVIYAAIQTLPDAMLLKIMAACDDKITGVKLRVV